MAIIGISFPFRRGTTSFPVQATDNDVIKDNIIRILQTMKGSRVMRPSSGSSAWAFVFENTGPVLNARLDHEVRKSVSDGEPRANVLNVNVSEEERGDGGKNIVVDVLYSVNFDIQHAKVTFSQPTGG